MIQGGKPATTKTTTSTDTKKSAVDEDDCSIWGGAFQDEFHDKLKHDGEFGQQTPCHGYLTNERFTTCPAT